MLRLFFCFLLVPLSAWALSAEAPLPDPAQEARARALFRELRCVVCQSESINDSRAQIAADMRRSVREQVAAGMSDAQITAYMVAHYGDFVLMRPMPERHPWLWLGPVLTLLVGVGIMWGYFRSKPQKKG